MSYASLRFSINSPLLPILILTSLIVLLLLWDKFRASYVFMGGAVFMVILGAVTVDDLLLGFSNKAVITIFLLVYLTSIVHEHFPLVSMLDKLFKRARSPRSFLFQMSSSVSLLSSVMNNTPIVALFIPYVYQWGKRNKVAPSRLLIPLSYAAIFGGMITVIGTSTNLVLNGFLLSRNETLLTFADFFLPGIIVTIVGIAFIVLFSGKLLPNHQVIDDNQQGVLREYLAETRLSADSPLVGLTIEQAKLRNLEGVYLAEIYRDGSLMPSVRPEDVLRANDRLYFAGDTNRVVEVIQTFSGLVWAKNEQYDLGNEADLVETVVPANSILHGKTLKQVNFRDRFDAAVIGIHRNGERQSGKLGEIPLQAGDLLLITAGKHFKDRVRRGKDLYTLQWINERSKTSRRQQTIFLLSLVFSIFAAILGWIDFVIALLLVLAVAVALGMFSSREIKRQTNLDLLLILGGAITVGKGFIDSGAAGMVSQPLLDVVQHWPTIATLIALFLFTLLFTSFVTNVAAVAIVFPIAWELIHAGGYNPTTVYLTLAFGASAAFLTPVSYQTNLMVYGPGKYTFKDFFKMGIPFTFAYAITALLSIILLHEF